MGQLGMQNGMLALYDDDNDDADDDGYEQNFLAKYIKLKIQTRVRVFVCVCVCGA